MGCISSKEVLPTSSTHLNNRHLLAFQPTAISALHLDHNLTDFEFEDAKLTIDALELIPDSKHDDNIIDRSRCYSKSCQSSPNDDKSTIERCASFHTVEEYDAVIQRISNNNKEIIITTDDDERGIRRKKIGEALAGSLNVEFQTVGSLRQWLDDHVTSPAAAGGGGGGSGDAGADFPTPKFGSYNNNSNNEPAPGMDSIFVEINSKEEEENVPEVDPDLVAAFEEYMQQLQSEEDDILKLIEADRAR